MATATKSKGRKSRKSRNRKDQKDQKQRQAVRMIRGQGEGRMTMYHCAAIERAKAEHWPILVVKRNQKTGQLQEVETRARMVHRRDLTEEFHETHDRAGEGKYIDHSALSEDRKTIQGPNHVNPYLADEGSYATIIDVCIANIIRRQGKAAVEALTARINQNPERGQYLVWQGKHGADGAIFVSEWFTADQLWALAQKHNSKLKGMLQRQKSQRKDVKKRKSAREKFIDNLNVIRRATAAVNAATGERELGGGATPYAFPLEQCQFAIDMYYLTTGWANGVETGEYFYRLAVGRSEPWTLYEEDWVYETPDSKIAFLNEDARKAVQAGLKKAS